MSAQATNTMPLETSAIAQILRALFPPSLLVHVGWGNGMGDLTQWTAWQVPHAFVIEAEESKLEACQARALALTQANGQTNPSWQTIHATLAAQGGEQPYHVASNPSESGLLPADSLQHAWPHLQTVASPTVVARSLDELWQDVSLLLPIAVSSHSTWLVIDCLPAADILVGGVSVLQSAQVVCARSLLANRALLSDQMRAAGWKEVGWAESQHPSFGHAWFSRDIALELDKAKQHQAKLMAERDELTKAKEAEAQAKTALQTQLEALTKDRSEQQVQLTKQTQAQADLQSELDKAKQHQAKLMAERDELTKAKEAETAAKNKAISEKEALTKEKQTEVPKHKENQERLQQLESINQDLQNRQHLQHEELVKAEAQIELIKDLLLREQGI